MGTTLEQKLFQDHYKYYSEIGIETIKQQSGQVEQVSSDYQGRVIYELLQNAFDKAEQNILVQVIGNSLYVANDGIKFNYIANYDYKNGTSKRGDFQSLCSISTSTKTVSKSIGNKGVGFKSVFSIAKDGYVNVFTKGEIHLDKIQTEENISFRIYDSFKDVSNLPTEFDKTIIEIITNKIKLVQKERSDRGVPGYYFPLHIEREDDFIKKLFDDGFVTVIEIPFQNKEEVKNLFKEIEKIHFEFIQLKHKDYPNSFAINFVYDDQEYTKSITKNSRRFFSALVENDEIKKLAKEAGVLIEKPEIAFLIKDKPDGLIYNYLPTQVASPFKYVDFHGDFHTTVDRKSINFDGKIGNYNRALYKACIELYLSVLKNFVYSEFEVSLNCKFVKNHSYRVRNFKWELLEFENNYRLFYDVQNILNISNNNYFNASKLLVGLSKKYFDKKRLPKEHQSFIKISLEFITYFARDDNQEYKWVDYFKTEFAKQLKLNDVKFIPNSILNENTELLYRKKADSNLNLPDFLGINITDFEIKDSYFRKELGIKEFTDNNEILKYFKQCSFSGETATNTLTEIEQKDLIKNLYALFSSKNESIFLSTHRIPKALTSISRDNSSTLNQANFNISTIFLKTNKGKYKPAQLCLSSEVDNDFINDCINGNKKNEFLKFLGVSLDSDYIFADGRLYDKLKEGLDFIPILIDRKEHKEEISSELIKNLFLISKKGEKIHPSTINNNDYKFLDKVSKLSLKEELDNLLVRKYDLFPREYKDVFKKRIENNFSSKIDIIRLYQSVFKMFEREGQYLVIENEKLKWINQQDFTVISSKEDFDLFKKIPNKRVLCYYSNQHLPDNLKHLIIIPRKGKILIENKIENEKRKKELEEKIVYILLSISFSKNSEINYLDDDKDLQEIQKKIDSLKIFDGHNLEQKIYFNDDVVISNKMYAFGGKETGELYFKYESNKKQIAAGISEFIFNNTSITESVELILFHKTIEDLKSEFENNDVALIQRKWKKDYNKNFITFQKQILRFFDIPEIVDEKWFIYNTTHKSDFLIKVDQNGQLEHLKEIILEQKSKKEFEGYFDSFELEIDLDDIYERISKIKIQLDSIVHDSKNEIQNDVDKLDKKLGCESKIEKIEKKINSLNLSHSSVIDKSVIEIKKQEIALENRIENIFKLMATSGTKKTEQTEFAGETKTIQLKAKVKKTIFQNSGTDNQTGEDLEIMGANGEERVLYYFILEFLKLNKFKRLVGINAVYDLLIQKLKNYPMEKYKDKCTEVLENDEELKKALIPLFYVTMHHKYAYFDLIVYKDELPTLIEVKTTYTENNNKFFLSIAEVDAARGYDNYEIVRDTPTSMIFLGNPIKLVESNFASVIGNNFILTPRNYEFKFKN